MTLHEALQAASKRIAAVSETATSDARALLMTVLAADRVWLLLHTEYELTPDQETAFLELVKRAESGEPLPYILGRRVFYDRDLLVSSAVLIPRPETELLLQQAIDYVGDRLVTVVDIGTGSGALAVTFAALKPTATVYAIDISPDALAIARQNAAHHAALVTFFEGDLLQPLIERGIRCDLIIANLPYIPTDEVKRLVVSKHEPTLALDGGEDGLVLIRRLLAQLPQVAKAESLILLEIMSGQGEAMRRLASEAFPMAEIEVQLDYAGHDRIVRIANVAK